MNVWYVYELPELDWKVVYLSMPNWPTECRFVWRDTIVPFLKSMTKYTGSDKVSEGFPVIVGLPNVVEMQYAFITKAGEEDGSTFVVTPQAMTWLDEWHIGVFDRHMDATAQMDDPEGLYGSPSFAEEPVAEESEEEPAPAMTAKDASMSNLLLKMGIFNPATICRSCYGSGTVWGRAIPGWVTWCKCPCVTRQEDYPRQNSFLTGYVGY